MTTAVLITPDLTAQRIHLPHAPAEQRAVIHQRLGCAPDGPVDAAYYHPANVFHLGGNSTGSAPLNTAAWALACTWRRRTLNYPLCGPVLITGAMEEGSTAYADLDPEQVMQAQQVTGAVRELLARHPGGVPVADVLDAARLS
ncbi:hypothetical protein ABZ569_33345 [Streptomyces albus]|uniref:hypothetical protein n=1 Tax=Streptomyces albus TaxID=1888 RepID=UPI003404637B